MLQQQQQQQHRAKGPAAITSRAHSYAMESQGLHDPVAKHAPSCSPSSWQSPRVATSGRECMEYYTLCSSRRRARRATGERALKGFLPVPLIVRVHAYGEWGCSAKTLVLLLRLPKSAGRNPEDSPPVTARSFIRGRIISHLRQNVREHRKFIRTRISCKTTFSSPAQSLRGICRRNAKLFSDAVDEILPTKNQIFIPLRQNKRWIYFVCVCFFYINLVTFKK